MQLDELMRLCAEKHPDWVPDGITWGPRFGDSTYDPNWLSATHWPITWDIARAAFLWHWQQRMDADDMNSIVIRFDHKACVMKTYWVEEFPESQPEIHEHPDRATALAAYVESQIGAPNA